MGRFINADAQTDGSAGFVGNNLFAYCANSPVSFKDSTGCAVETVLDIVGITFSLVDLVIAPSWANLGYLVWDIASAFVPFVPGSYVAKGGKIFLKVASKIDDFMDGAKFVTGTYNKLKKLFNGIKGIDVHHLIEKRFAPLFNCTKGNFLSIPLTKELHKIITKRWRYLYTLGDTFAAFRYGADYTKITYEMMEDAIRIVYGDMPSILDDVLEWLKKNWKG